MLTRVGRRARSSGRGISSQGIDQRERVILLVRRSGLGDSPGRGLLVGVVRDETFQRRQLFRQGRLSSLPRLEGPGLLGDDEAAQSGLHVNDETLDQVGHNQRFLGLPRPPLHSAQVRDRDEQDRERDSDNQRERTACQHHPSGQPAAHSGLRLGEAQVVPSPEAS